MHKNTIDFIRQVSLYAINACHSTHLFPSLMIAQACLESNYGKSKLASLHHNYFGIKANAAWKGENVLYNTTEYVNHKAITVKQSFRKYPTLQDGFADRVKFLQVNPRYAKHGIFLCKTPEEQAAAFLRAGYATDPSYPQKLIAIIHQYNLTQYDLPCKTPSNTSITI